MAELSANGATDRPRHEQLIRDGIDYDVDDDIPLPPRSEDDDSSEPPPLSISDLLYYRGRVPISFSTPQRPHQQPVALPPTGEMHIEPTTSNTVRRRREMRAASSQPELRRTQHHRRRRWSYGSCSETSLNDDLKSTGNGRDTTAYLKYMVRGFLRQFRGASSADGDEKVKFAKQDSFIPSPKITFLIDEPDNLICQICHQASLRLAITSTNPRPETTAILPCGHVFCIGCLRVWLSNHASCPLCRTSMTHNRCGHQVTPRIIAHDTIHSIPETLTQGGKIGQLCFKCVERERRDISVQRWTVLAERFRVARREAERLDTDEAIADMRKAQKAFERIPEDDFWVLSRIRRCQW